MNIVDIELSKLIGYENNPRKNDKAVDAVAESIKQFGFKVPIIIDKDYVIVAGHTRKRAAEKLGLKTAPCIIADDLTEEQVQAFRLVENKTNELAEWDFNKLEAELAELSMFDMGDFGFDMKTLDPDQFGDDFELPDGDKSDIEQMTFTLHREQAELIRYAMDIVKDDIVETFGNTNKNGNSLYEVVRQWAEQRK